MYTSSFCHYYLSYANWNTRLKKKRKMNFHKPKDQHSIEEIDYSEIHQAQAHTYQNTQQLRLNNHHRPVIPKPRLKKMDSDV